MTSTPPVDLTKKRTDECVPIVRDILKVIGEIAADCMLGEFDVEEGRAAYLKIVEEKILPILHAANIRTFDLSYIMKMMMQPLDFIKQLTVDSVEIAEDNAIAMKFEVADQKDIRFSNIIQAQLENEERKRVAANTGQSVDNPAGGMVVDPRSLE